MEYLNREVDFCRVHDLATKEKVEKILLENRISYFIDWEDRGLSALFPFRKKNRCVCIFRIHSDEVNRARELLRPVLNNKANTKTNTRNAGKSSRANVTATKKDGTL